MTVKRSDDRVEATLDDLNIVCKPDMIWHFTLGDKESGISAQFVHAGNGCPAWYGKGTPAAHTPHTVAFGYFWSRRVEGTLTIQGGTVKIRGAGLANTTTPSTPARPMSVNGMSGRGSTSTRGPGPSTR